VSKFSELWDNHPTVESFIDDFPCKKNGKKAFDNQCSIRMGSMFEKSGVKTDSFRGARCWHGHKPAHILRAEELANWLAGPFSPFKTMVKFDGISGFSQISGKKGIIFFKDYYGQNSQGDHIDLWNGNRHTKYTSWIEFAFRDGRHYSKAKVWFWPVI